MAGLLAAYGDDGAQADVARADAEFAAGQQARPRFGGAKRIGFLVAGCLSLALAAIGVALPVLPTTPLVLLAAICFERSSPRLQAALAQSRLFGPFIVNYRKHTGITIRRKVVTLIILWAGLITSSFFVPYTWIVAVLGVIGLGVTTHILLIKTASVAKVTAQP